MKTNIISGEDITLEFKIRDGKIVTFINGREIKESAEEASYYQNEDASRIVDNNGKAYVTLAMVNQGEGINIKGFNVKLINNTLPNQF